MSNVVLKSDPLCQAFDWDRPTTKLYN